MKKIVSTLEGDRFQAVPLELKTHKNQDASNLHSEATKIGSIKSSKQWTQS